MIGAISTALTGLSAATRKVEASAASIAGATRASTPEVDLAAETVTLKLGAASYKANLAVIRTADEMNEALLNRFDERV